MKKFLISGILFFALFFIVEKAFYFFIVKAPETEVDKRLEWLINGKINKDVVIIGSSRGARDLVASQLESKLNTSCFNLSYPGSNVEFHEFLLRSLLKFNKKPKLVILTVDYPIELTTDPILNFRLDRLYPLVKYNYITDELVSRGEKNEWMSKIFMLHRMNKSNFDIRAKHFTDLDTLLACGSMPIAFQKTGGVDWNSKAPLPAYQVKSELPEKIKAFQKLIRTCKESNIKLLLVSPPLYYKTAVDFNNRIQLFSKNAVPFYSFNVADPVYSDKSYYYDETHLMKNGALHFTEELADYIKSTQLLP